MKQLKGILARLDAFGEAGACLPERLARIEENEGGAMNLEHRRGDNLPPLLAQIVQCRDP